MHQLRQIGESIFVIFWGLNLMSQKPWPDVTNLPDGVVGIAFCPMLVFAMKLFLVEKSMSEKNPLKNSNKQSPMIVPSIQWKLGLH